MTFTNHKIFTAFQCPSPPQATLTCNGLELATRYTSVHQNYKPLRNFAQNYSQRTCRFSFSCSFFINLFLSCICFFLRSQWNQPDRINSILLSNVILYPLRSAEYILFLIEILFWKDVFILPSRWPA